MDSLQKQLSNVLSIDKIGMRTRIRKEFAKNGICFVKYMPINIWHIVIPFDFIYISLQAKFAYLAVKQLKC